MSAIAGNLSWIECREASLVRGKVRLPHRALVMELPGPVCNNRPRTAPSAEACDPPPAPIVQIAIHPIPVWKRAMDIVGASLGLLLLLPLLIAVVIAIKLTSRGPVMFRQWCAGLGGRPFRIYKFRTMIDGAERLQGDLLRHNQVDGPVFKMDNDPRLTRVGWLLRRTSLDEVPQLWNVLRGDMSLVGPRPLDIRESARCQPWQFQRLQVTPGLTCILAGPRPIARDV